MACPAISPGGAFLSGVLDYVDCQAQVLGQNGWHALAAPGSTVSLILGGLLTIFIAFFGYRLLLGHVPDLREGVVAIVKIGLVLVLATSWPAFRTLAYDVTMRGPAELAASIGGAGALPGAGGGLVARLQRIDNGLVELIELGTGNPNSLEQPVQPGPAASTSQQQTPAPQRPAQRLRWDPIKDAEMVAQGRTLYLTGAIAGFASVRIVAGLLLALGPLFALFLLFDATRGLFEGWVRGVAGAGLGALATSIVLGVEIALLEPWLAQVLSARRADVATPTAPVELLVMSLVFGLTLIVALIAVARVAQGFRIPDSVRAWPAQVAGSIRTSALPALPANRPPDAHEQRSRAYLVADAVTANQRREQATAQPATLGRGGRTAGIGQALARDAGAPSATPLGQTSRRRTSSRISAGATRRDGTI